jgi:hypothetical protein
MLKCNTAHYQTQALFQYYGKIFYKTHIRIKML